MVTSRDSSQIRECLIDKIIEEKFGRIDEKTGTKIAKINVNGLSKYQFNRFVAEITKLYNNIHFVGKEGWTRQIRIGEDKYTPSIGRIENSGDAFNIHLDKKEIAGAQNVQIMEEIIRIAEEKLKEKETTQETFGKNKNAYGISHPTSKKTKVYQYKGFLKNRVNFSWELNAPFFDYIDSYQY